MANGCLYGGEFINLGKKVFAGSLLSIMLIIVYVFVFAAPFGSPWGWLVAKYKLDKYSKAVYGDEIKQRGVLTYNLKDNSYWYDLIIKGNNAAVTIKYNPYRRDISDSLLYLEKLDEKLKEKVKAMDNVLGKDINLPPATAYFAIDADQDFSNQPLKRKDKLYLLGITNTDVDLTPEQSEEKMLEIISAVYKNLGDEYNFTSSQIIYTDINGTKETDISAGDSMLPYEQIKQKINDIAGGEVQDQFIKQLKDVKSGILSKSEINPYK